MPRSAPQTVSKMKTSQSYQQPWSPLRAWSEPLAGFEIRWRLNWMKHKLRVPMTMLGGLLLLSGAMMLGAMALSGCATRLVATEVNIPPELQGRCDRTPLPPKNPEATPSELLSTTQRFSLSQEVDLNICEAKSMAKDAIINEHNRSVRRATCAWWKMGLCQ